MPRKRRPPPEPPDNKPEEQQPAVEQALDERARRLREIQQFIDQTSFAGDEREVADELSSADQQEDIANLTFQRELDGTIRRIVELEEEQIERARERRQAGTYGICESCGREIPPERLRARPEATLCLDCQREQERHFSA